MSVKIITKTFNNKNNNEAEAEEINKKIKNCE